MPEDPKKKKPMKVPTSAEPNKPRGVFEKPEHEKPKIRLKSRERHERDPESYEDKMTDVQKELKRKMDEKHPGKLDPRTYVEERNVAVSDEEEDEMVARARQTRFYEAAVATASRLSMEANRRLDGLPPSPNRPEAPPTPPAASSGSAQHHREEDGQPKQKEPRVEEIRMIEMTEEELMMTVVESKLNPEEKKAFTEAKRKALTPWNENDACDLTKGLHAHLDQLFQRGSSCATSRPTTSRTPV